MTLDLFDRKILELMQLNCKLSSESIAEKVGLSASAVQRRLKRLREEGAICSEVAIVNPALSPNYMSFIAGLEIERDNYRVLSQLSKWAEQQMSIQQLFYVTGQVDVMLVVSAPSAKAYDQFIETLMARYPQIRRVTTNVVINNPKRNFYVPMN